MILLGWATSAKEHLKNFGDELSPYIIEKISGKKVSFVPPVKRRRIPLVIIKGLLFRQLSFKRTIEYIRYFFCTKYLISLGSIINWYNAKGGIVWGSGIMDRNAKIANLKFVAVRGKYTANRINELNLTSPSIFGDPALLLPLIFKPLVQKKYRLGIIPHKIHFRDFQNIGIDEDILLIELTSNVEETIEKINSCEFILSTSLHGLIVSHAYHIPALHIHSDIVKKQLLGDNVKFLDYYSVVNIQEYSPININIKERLTLDVLGIFEDYKNSSTINVNIHKLQIELLKSFPFFNSYTQTILKKVLE